MQGSIFIVHNGTWSCSNDAIMGVFSTPIMNNGKLQSVKDENIITVYSPFHASQPLHEDDKCEIVFLNEETDVKYAFIGNVRNVGKLHTILNIFAKSERISEILANITFKN